MRTKFAWTLALGAAAALACTTAMRAATPEQIATAIDNGIVWLVAQQQPDGSWGAAGGSEPVAGTALAVVKLEELALELGYASPFDDAYPYKGNVVNGLNYLFSQTATYGAGTGICFTTFPSGFHETYRTGLGMMALAGSKTPDRVVPAVGSLVDGWTYKQVLQACVDYFAFAQNPDGGWRYFWTNEPSDNSNTGYAVLGLRYAEAPTYGFNCVIPAALKINLSGWLDLIQGPDGGSQYTVGGDWENLLKTGNLLFEQSFVGDPLAAPRVQNAITYIQNTWNDPSPDPGWRPYQYQAMYCLMKGLVSFGVDTLTVAGNPVNWYAEFAEAIVTSQMADGSWPWDMWGDSVLTTVWSLMVLEKVAPPPPTEVVLTLPACACDQTGYPITATYTVERFIVDGTLKLIEDGVVVDTLPLDDFTGTATHSLTLASDTPGLHLWKAELEVTPVGGGTPAQADDEQTVTVCETPQVGDIPDQTAPFASFDLDDYLGYGGALAVTWTAAGEPADWTVVIDADNVATVVAPVGAIDPATITFTASVSCCAGVVCATSDAAMFTPNQAPDASQALPSIARIWPPDHRMVGIEVLGVTDPDGDPVTITIDAIWQDEPVDTQGDGSLAPDGFGIGTSVASVRAERAASKKVVGNGRMYHIRFTADDGRGMSDSGEVLVAVPNNIKSAVIDGGALYDSTVIP